LSIKGKYSYDMQYNGLEYSKLHMYSKVQYKLQYLVDCYML
jgi:hypothetical protein